MLKRRPVVVRHEKSEANSQQRSAFANTHLSCMRRGWTGRISVPEACGVLTASCGRDADLIQQATLHIVVDVERSAAVAYQQHSTGAVRKSAALWQPAAKRKGNTWTGCHCWGQWACCTAVAWACGARMSFPLSLLRIQSGHERPTTGLSLIAGTGTYSGHDRTSVYSLYVPDYRTAYKSCTVSHSFCRFY